MRRYRSRWEKRFVEADDAERKESGEKKGVALSEVVVPAIAAVEDCEGSGDIEVEEAVGWKGPFLVVVAIRNG